MIGQGSLVDEFEESIRKRLALSYVVVVNSSSSAIRLALDIAGVRPGDEVITTPITCTLTNHPILEQFATPVFADIQVDTGNIDPADVNDALHREQKQLYARIGVAPLRFRRTQSDRAPARNPVIEDASERLGLVITGARSVCIRGLSPFRFTQFKS